ncbi:MAG: S-layer homology domain-containing protein [Oscillibacter sp.]|nr:S-layer homology domain-containing protein [Oscillibacter sp.]
MNSTGTGYEGFTVTPYVDNVLVTPTNPTYTWSVNGTPVSNYYYNSFNLTSYNASLHYGNTANTVSCKATFTWNNQTFTTDEYTWTVYTGYNNYLASVNVTNSYTYALGNRDDNNGSSIVDQLSSRYYNAGYYTPSSVQFLSTTHTYGTLNANTTTTYSLSSANANYLGNVVFTPSNSAGKAVFSVRVYFSNSATPLDGTICFDTSGTTVTSGDINYSGALGDTVYFDASDFADFYYSKTSGGSLNYVTFSTVSSGTGTLYCNGSRLSSAAYYSATSTQNALDGVYFTPSGTTASRGGTVRIGFTASGTRYGYGYNGTISGTVVINYLNGAAKDITYTPTGSSINLSASDFTAAYREVMGSTAPSDLTIQFQDVPDNGTLTYKSSSTATPVTLRATNVKSYRFSTNGSSSNQIANVTYTVSGTRSDTVEYIAYTGGVARFTGKVIFNPSSVSTSVIVTLTCPSSTGGAFNLAEFTKANAVVMANTFQVRFLMPTRGTLTYGGMTATAAGLTVPVNMINSVFYKPNAGMNGIDTVGFVCLDASGNQVGTGQVNVVVSGSTGTSTNTGVTSISQFTDVPANAWYATVLADLVSRGIVQGTGNGKAEPRGTLNYGQALKMILLAAGYPAQAELNSGTQWAANYKSLAVSNGLIDSSVDLTAPISRDAVVELIAKALKVSPVSGNSPFKDSNNPYAIALNRTNPAIIIGNEDGTFNGSSTLLRQEVWAIVYRMNQYTSTQYSTQVPDGI